MQVLYMYMPELPRTRHIIVGDKHVINTAAPESTIFHKIARRKSENQSITRCMPEIRESQTTGVEYTKNTQNIFQKALTGV